MFSNLILRNSKRNRKENGLFFGSLVISIVAFYIILSLSKQDVMVFLHIPQELRIRSRGTERHSASN